jgi:hypothetical protein
VHGAKFVTCAGPVAAAQPESSGRRRSMRAAEAGAEGGVIHSRGRARAMPLKPGTVWFTVLLGLLPGFTPRGTDSFLPTMPAIARGHGIAGGSR